MMQRMTLDKWMKCGVLGLVIVALSGCNTMTALSVSAIDRGYVCGINQAAGVQLVSDSAPQTDGSRIGVGSNANQEGSDADLDTFWIVRVNMGQQPSGGYALRLISDHLEISSDTARITLEWLQPGSGSVQIQTLTYPCLYLKVAKGNYSRLDIADQQGDVRFSLDLKQ